MRSICDYQKTRFFDSFKPIYRHVIGMRKKILFKVKYVRVYLMLNALCVKLMLAAVAARSSVQVCRRIVLNLSVFVSVLKSVFIQDFINTFNFIKTIKTWSGIYENYEVNKVYKS